MLRTLTFLAALALAGQAQAQHAGHAMQGADMHGGAPREPGVRRSMVRLSSPAEGEVINAPPSEFTVTFSHAMTLNTIKLTDSAGRDIPVTAPVVAVDESSARIALPALAKGGYALSWFGQGAGSARAMKGEFAFFIR